MEGIIKYILQQELLNRLNKNQIEFSGKRNKMVATIDAPGEFEITYETIQQDEPDFTRVCIRLKKSLQSGKVNIIFSPVQ